MRSARSSSSSSSSALGRARGVLSRAAARLKPNAHAPATPAADADANPPAPSAVLLSPSPGRFSSSAPSISIDHRSSAPSPATPAPQPLASRNLSESATSLAPPRAPWLGRASSSNGRSDSSLLSLSDPFAVSSLSVTAPPSPAYEGPVVSPGSSAVDINSLALPCPDEKACQREGRWERFRRSSIMKNVLKKHAASDPPSAPALSGPTPPARSPAATQIDTGVFTESPRDTSLLDLPTSPLSRQHDTTDSPMFRSATIASSQSTTEELPSINTASTSYPSTDPQTHDLCPSLPPSVVEHERNLSRPTYLTVAAPLDGIALSPGQIVDSQGKVLPAVTTPAPAPVRPAAAPHEVTPLSRSNVLSSNPLFPSTAAHIPESKTPGPHSPQSTHLPDFLAGALNFEPDLMPDTPALSPLNRSPEATPAHTGWGETQHALLTTLPHLDQTSDVAATTGSTAASTEPGSSSETATASRSPIAATDLTPRAPSPAPYLPSGRYETLSPETRPRSPSSPTPRSTTPTLTSPRTSGMASAAAFKRAKSPTRYGHQERAASPSPAVQSSVPDVLSVLDSGAKRALYNCTLLKLQPRIAVALKDAMVAADEPALTGSRTSLSPDAARSVGNSVMAAVASPTGVLTAHMRALMVTATKSVDKGLVADLAFPRSMNSARAAQAHESAYNASRDLRAALGRSLVLVRLLAPGAGPLPRNQAQEISSLQIRYGRELVPPAVVSLAGRAGPSSRAEALTPPMVVMPNAQTPVPTHGLAKWVARPSFAERCREWVPQVDEPEVVSRPVAARPGLPLRFSTRMQALAGPTIQAREAVAPSAGPSQPGRQRRFSSLDPSSPASPSGESPFRRRRLSQALASSISSWRPQDKRMSLSAVTHLSATGNSVPKQQDKRMSLSAVSLLQGTGSAMSTSRSFFSEVDTSAPPPLSNSAKRQSTASIHTLGSASSRRRSAPWLSHSQPLDTEDPDMTITAAERRRSTHSPLSASGSQATTLPSSRSSQWHVPSSISPQKPSPLSMAVQPEEQDHVTSMRPMVPRSTSAPQTTGLRQSRGMGDALHEFGTLPEAESESDSEEERPLSALWARGQSSQTPASPTGLALASPGRTSPSPQLPAQARSPTVGGRLPLAPRSSSALDKSPLPSVRSGSALDRSPRLAAPNLHGKGGMSSPCRSDTAGDRTAAQVDPAKRRESIQAREAQLQEAHKAMLKQNRDRRRTSRSSQTLLDPMYGAGHASTRAPAQVYAGSHARAAAQVPPTHRYPSDTGLSGSGSASGTSAGTTSPTQPATPPDNGPLNHARSSTPAGRKSASPRVSLSAGPGWHSPGPSNHAPLVDLSRDGGALRGVAPRSVTDDDDRKARRKSHSGQRPPRSASRTSMASAPGGMGGARTPTRDSWHGAQMAMPPYTMGMGGMPMAPMHMQQMAMQQPMYHPQMQMQMPMGMMPPPVMHGMPMYGYPSPVPAPQPTGRRSKNPAVV